jgi:hypothetical protein
VPYFIYRVVIGPKAGKIGCTKDLSERVRDQGLNSDDVRLGTTLGRATPW